MSRYMVEASGRGASNTIYPPVLDECFFWRTSALARGKELAQSGRYTSVKVIRAGDRICVWWEWQEPHDGRCPSCFGRGGTPMKEVDRFETHPNMAYACRCIPGRYLGFRTCEACNGSGRAKNEDGDE